MSEKSDAFAQIRRSCTQAVFINYQARTSKNVPLSCIFFNSRISIKGLTLRNCVGPHKNLPWVEQHFIVTPDGRSRWGCRQGHWLKSRCKVWTCGLQKYGGNRLSLKNSLRPPGETTSRRYYRFFMRMKSVSPNPCPCLLSLFFPLLCPH